MNRREFVQGSAAVGAVAAIAAASPTYASASERPIRIDAEGASGSPELDDDGIFRATPRLLKALHDGTVNVFSLTLGDPGNGSNRFQRAVGGVAWLDKVIAGNGTFLLKVERGRDLIAARDTRHLGIIYTIPDSTCLEGEASKVETFQSLGVRMMQLTYNKRNLAGDGCMEKANAGISEFGGEVIAAMNKSRLLLDLSHAGPQTMADAIAASKAPSVISHSGCRALVDLPRNTRDEEMRALADRGGVFGVYMMPFLRIGAQPQRDDFLRHVEHARNVCGEDHIGIGTDNPLFGYVIDDAARKPQREFYEDRAKQGIAAPGEGADVFNLVEGYNDIGRYDGVAADLKSRGWTSAQVDKLLGNNFARVFTEVWG